MPKIRAFLELIRPANVITAWSDSIAGMSLVGFGFGFANYQIKPMGLLGLASMLLYAGGVMLNDVMDANLDALERPERAIPSGRFPKSTAAWASTALLLLGTLLAGLYSPVSGSLALVLSLFILYYDWKAKHHAFAGPLIMGACRGLNLLLGMSVYDLELLGNLHLFLIPLGYIAGITLISRGEVHGGKTWTIYLALGLFIFVQICQGMAAWKAEKLVYAAPFLLIHAYLLYPKLWNALRLPSGPNIGKAVGAGVIALIALNATWASMGEQWYIAIFVLALLPISRIFAKLFAVT